MADDVEILTMLAAPFPPQIVSWRVGAMTDDKTRGLALAYLDSRDVQDRLNEVCGAYWQVRHPWTDSGLIACEIGIKIGDEWIWRGDGAGESEVDEKLTGPRKEQQIDMARKAAFSDSFKRAAVRWGIGRYLYDVDAPWVQLEPRGRSYVIPERELAKLRARLGGTARAPENATTARPSGDVRSSALASGEGGHSAPPSPPPQRPAAKLPPAVPRNPAQQAPTALPSASKQLTLGSIRDGINLAVNGADTVDRIDTILTRHKFDLDQFLDPKIGVTGRVTHNAIIQNAKDRAAALGGSLDNWDLVQ